MVGATVEAGGQAVVLYDGDCGLCCRLVDFLARRDVGGTLRFAPLASAAARTLLSQHGLPPEATETVVLVEGGRAYAHSTAALRTLRHLRRPWPLLDALRVVPRPVRDAVYAWVARHRRRWFGGAETCPAPSPDLRRRMLE